MALLQISEPGRSPDPHARRLVVGIDLGTTHSLVAALRHGVVECLPDAEGRVLLPSVVRYLPGGGCIVGWDAQAAQADDPANTIVSVKRLMGRRLAELPPPVARAAAVVETPAGVALATRTGTKSPVEVSAEILATLRRRAEETLGGELHGAVVTVPAYFDDAQRQATKDAARLAGIEVLRLLSEPTAAALAYGLDRGAEGLYAVYDLGGGTFDISLLRLARGVFEVVATGGDSLLGGDDIDHALADWALREAGADAATPAERRAAIVAARRAKEALSTGEHADWRARIGGRECRVALDRARLEAIAAPSVERTLKAVRRVLRDARCAPSDVEGIVMVGGATRMPLVRREVEALFGRPVLTDVNPDEVVATGAAIQANALAGNAGERELLLLDVIALSLGIETMGGLVERIVERNTSIPVAKAQEFTTFKDGQTAIAIHVVQGERELVSECRSLARFELRGLPPLPAGVARIRVTFQVDADGLLSVTAREQTSAVEAAVTVRPSYGLDDAEISRMLREAYANAEQDMQARALREARVEAERLALATRSALAADGALLDAPERSAIEALVLAAERSIDSHDPQAIDAAVKALAEGTEAFAAERMNRSIRAALAGRSIDEV